MKKIVLFVMLCASACYGQIIVGGVQIGASKVAAISSTPTLPYSGAGGSLTFSTSTSGAAIHCNTSAAPATCSDTDCTSGVTVSATTTYYAVGCKTGYANSDQFSGTYTVQTGGEVASDDFAYSNGNLVDLAGGKWTMAQCTSAGFPVWNQAINSNSSGGWNCLVYWSGTGSFATNQYATVTIISTPSDGNAAGPAVRISSGQGYVLKINQTGQVNLGKETGGTDPSILVSYSTCGTVAVNDTITLQASGTTTTALTVKKNGTTICSYNDSSSPLTTGVPGMYGNGGGTTIDNWKGGNL